MYPQPRSVLGLYQRQRNLGGHFGEIFNLVCVCSWLGEGTAPSSIYLCLETQRGLCRLTMGTGRPVCVLCICLCGRGAANSHTQAD